MQNDSTMLPMLPQVGVEIRLVDGHPGYAIGSDGTPWTAWKRRGLAKGFGTIMEIGNEWKRLKPAPIGNGYLQVKLYKDGIKTHIGVHRLVCMAFHGNPPFDGAQVCHKDGSRSNNVESNLRWGTAKSNMDDRSRHGKTVRGERINTAKLTPDDVRAIRIMITSGDTRASIGRRFGVSAPTIGRIDRRENWAHIA